MLKYISLFSGGFGLDLGIEQAAYKSNVQIDLRVCLDISLAARETIRLNRPSLNVIGDNEGDFGGDLYQINSNLILQRANLAIKEADLVVGGPPCQSFSILGNRQGFEDPRGNLMLEFVRVVREIQPKCFVMENVAGFLSVDKGKSYQKVIDLFTEAGYLNTLTWVLDAVNFGVPQFRRRVFIIGFREGMEVRGLVPPDSTYFPPDAIGNNRNGLIYRCVRDVLENMPDGLANNERRIHSERVRTRYEQLVQGARDRIDHTDRLAWDRPSGTVLVGSTRGGGRPFIHPFEPRHLTVREAARLQGFPDDWVFAGNQTDQYRQVGNAIPPLLSEVVTRQIIAFLTQENPNPNEETLETNENLLLEMAK
ncbi:MAG: DNA cytosine methyltransferase [Chloroflexi bacterium]|uniref:Cytosine-specific methyltransferase n=1 Tax=Candidatus Chlorohelix allophototropha TaxID=3003348 RepID=A0A8T7M4M7_9CHLR|nr:DNA cytosine methyltransferase [Chloroflexota bacterium]WJW70347.1 DNA cytosine methyltransferase [Chloroflexota bacterium L227-S17]